MLLCPLENEFGWFCRELWGQCRLPLRCVLIRGGGSRSVHPPPPSAIGEGLLLGSVVGPPASEGERAPDPGIGESVTGLTGHIRTGAKEAVIRTKVPSGGGGER